MARDFGREARDQVERQEASRLWVRARTDAVLKFVTAHDVLRRNGIKLKQSGADREEQFSCPFHGRDNTPSARVYPETVRGPSHVWCFVCHTRWDVIGLWKKFSGADPKFTRVLAEIERAFGIIPPEAPPIDYDVGEDPEIAEIILLFDVCERRLLSAKRAFDMKAYLTIGSVLDRLRNQFEEQTATYNTLKDTLQKVLDKIGEKERSCLAG